VEEDAGDGYAVVVTEAEVIPGRSVVASLKLCNGKVAFPARGDLMSDVFRRRFLKGAEELGATPDRAALGGVLVKLCEGLPDEVQRRRQAAADAEAAAGAAGASGEDPEALLEQAGAIPEDPSILDSAYLVMRGHGLVGEARNAKLLYLAAVARLFGLPVNSVVKGPSSGGKSYLLKRVVRLLPDEEYVEFTSFSGKFLMHWDGDLRHRILVLYEQQGVDDPDLAYVVRSLLSEGRIKYGVSEKVVDEAGERWVGVVHEKPGPTALFTSTTRAAIEPETETRTLSVAIDDTPAQSRAIMREAARRRTGEAPPGPDLAPWHAFQRWLRVAGERRCVIPFAPALGELVPANAIRVRRDFEKLLTLVGACAVLHQRQRERDAERGVAASLDDYELVRDLTTEAYAAAQDDGLTPAQREAVEAVRALCAEQRGATGDAEASVTLTAVAGRLSLDKSATSRRLANPVAKGYVLNPNAHLKGKPAAYVPGEALPEAVSELPTRQEVEEYLSTRGLREVAV
jgi:hypothetical protein